MRITLDFDGSKTFMMIKCNFQVFLKSKKTTLLSSLPSFVFVGRYTVRDLNEHLKI